MPEYAGFADLANYLRVRCAGKSLSCRKASKLLSASDSYVRDLIAGRIRPSLERCDAIAALFGDSPRLVRILAGHELQSTHRDPVLDALVEVCARLAPTGREDVLRYARFMADANPAVQR